MPALKMCSESCSFFGKTISALCGAVSSAARMPILPIYMLSPETASIAATDVGRDEISLTSEPGKYATLTATKF